MVVFLSYMGGRVIIQPLPEAIDSTANLREFSLIDPKIRVDWRRLADKKTKCDNPSATTIERIG
jgi:hypothetical protein